MAGSQLGTPGTLAGYLSRSVRISIFLTFFVFFSCQDWRAGPWLSPPDLREVLTANCESRDGQAIDLLILHHTASAYDALHQASFFQDPGSAASVHYIIDRDGSIVRSVPDSLRAWHAGTADFQGASNVNQRSIGIELCNVGDNSESYPDAQVAALVRLMAWLSWAYGIPEERFARHRDVAIPAGRKSDTSDNLDVAWVYEAVVLYRDSGILESRSLAKALGGRAQSGQELVPDRTMEVREGDSWESLSLLIYDSPALAPSLRAANPGADLRAGSRITWSILP